VGRAEWLREAGRTPVALDAASVCSRRVASRPDLNAIRRACRLADVVQQAVKDHAAPGLSEAELAARIAQISNTGYTAYCTMPRKVLQPYARD
jgi:Xaa-Pro aminopeptidase